MKYKCTNGHDKCNEMYPGKECPYCEKVKKKIVPMHDGHLLQSMFNSAYGPIK